MNTKSVSHFIARPLSLLAAMFTLIPVGLATSTADDAHGRGSLLHHRRPHILPPQPRHSQRIYAAYQARWWQWVLSQPVDHSPILDTADGSAGQAGPVWFLAGSFGTDPVVRTLTVPSGKALFFPVLNNVFFITEPDENEAVARAAVNAAVDQAVIPSLFVQIDGHSVAHLDRYRTESALFDTGSLPANNLFGLPAGTVLPGVDDGFYLLLAPLSPGEHTIHFGGAFADGFSQDITNHITVERRR